MKRCDEGRKRIWVEKDPNITPGIIYLRIRERLSMRAERVKKWGDSGEERH